MARSDTKIARQYAKALFELSSPTELEKREKALNDIAADWNSHAHLARTLEDPASPIAQRTEALRAYVEAVLPGDATFSNFLATMLEGRRLSLIPATAEVFGQMILAFKKIFSLQITTASPVSDSERNEIAERVRRVVPQQFASLVSIDWDNNKSLIGGMIVKSGDKVLDGSVNGALERMGRALL